MKRFLPLALALACLLSLAGCGGDQFIEGSETTYRGTVIDLGMSVVNEGDRSGRAYLLIDCGEGTQVNFWLGADCLCDAAVGDAVIVESMEAEGLDHPVAIGITIDEAPEVVPAEPPALTVLCRETAIEAMRGTTSWWYQNGDGTGASIESDSMHPLQAREYMPALNLLPSYYSHIQPYAAYLRFETVPDLVTVRCWPETCWGQPDAQSEDIAVDVAGVDFGDGQFVNDFVIQLKEGNYIYEVVAEWNRSEDYGGTASYCFYTVEPELVLHPVH